MACAFILCAIETVAVGVRIVLTVHETDATVATSTGTRFSRAFCQGCSRNCGGQGCTNHGASNPAYRGTSSDLFVCHSFGDVFEPISHRHLLVLL
jgi:hypothetical protein